VGAARACDPAGSGNINLPDQVDTYLSDVGGAPPPDALYVIEMGGNDVRDAIAAALGVLQAGGTLDTAVQAALPVLVCAQQSIQAAIGALSAAGARQFLVWTAPDPGLTPALRSLPASARALATFLTILFNNQMLLPTLQGLDQSSEDVQIAVLDAFTLLQQIIANPENFGLTETTSACITPNDAPFFCQEPDEYLFWDGIHPTRSGHAIVADEASRILGGQQ
jgi:phospholipase/lecithinase/hemolysin